jgi:hypothetical protein
VAVKARHRRLATGARLLAGLLLWLLAGPAPAESALELKVKAAFLFNFARYTTWPAEKFNGPADPIRICVLEPDAFGEVLEATFKGKTIESRPLLVFRATSATALRGCHIVYATSSRAAQLESAFVELAGASTLTVHDFERTLSGGVVRFFIENSKVRFEINALAAEREKLVLNPKLLGLAITVRK